MPSFAIGATINLTVDADDTYTFTGIADMTITSTQGTQTVHLDGTQTIGPYKVQTSVSIKAITAGSYDRIYAANGAFTLGSLTAAEIAVVNASLAAGTASFPVGTLATVDGAMWSLAGLGTSAVFSSVGGSGGSSATIADLLRTQPLFVPVRGFLNNWKSLSASNAAATDSQLPVASLNSGTVNLAGRLNKSAGTIAAKGENILNLPTGYEPAYLQGHAGGFLEATTFNVIACQIGFDAQGTLPIMTANVNTATTPFLLETNASFKAAPILSGAAYQRNAAVSDDVAVLFPAALPASAKVCMYFHGAGDDYLSHLTGITAATSTQLLFRATLKALLADGWIVITSSGGSITDHWGNPASWLATQAALAWLKTKLTVAKLSVVGQSMGGLTSLRALAQYSGITNWYGIYPVCNLAYMQASSSFTSAINTAFGGAPGFAANVADCDPMQFSTSQYGGKNMRMTASASDTIVSKANNSDLLVTKVTGTAASVVLTTHTGTHGDPSAFIPADVVAQCNL
ncbi:hypothetical protein RD110_10960 [Rhodoferax koreense]|uniref:Uncharacterized protein n=1 Tax=Rhodoferax koreensis TaxID=1842727 RepID=A0A1P8JV68_9BURK|nr:hypothetical protein [Rhodoferax koreense]APW37647.1 hypothetical protein RD110_10960 [Rhodoferax koreense]